MKRPLRLFIFAALLPLFTGCKERSETTRVSSFPTAAEFTRQVAAAYRQKDPALKVEVTGDLELKLSSASGAEATSYLDNTYALYRQDPAAKEELVGKLVDVGLESISLGEKPLDRQRIVPVVKDRGWLAEMKQAMRERGQAEPPEHVHEDLNEELVIVYAEDGDSGVSYPAEEAFREAGVDRKDLRELACANLKRILPELQRVGEDGYYLLVADGNYESSLLLLESIWKPEKLEVKGEIVVAIPARDTLFVTGSEETEGLAKVKAAAAKVAGESTYRLTPSLFVFRGGRFQKFE